MRALLQRVRLARVAVSEQIVGQIGQGVLVLLGIGQEDSGAWIMPLAGKLFIYVSFQFTLYAGTGKR
ncbi:MAG TPA: D-aminoacyl-tRNA deacylase [Ktedonobacteraceae bacterium]|nr:D-aminoacyl-tRNA deacylase [Ktedonobacteraceae bacterium]